MQCADSSDAVASSTPNLAVERTRHGELVATRALDDSGVPGALFGIALTDFGHAPSLVYVDDNDDSVNILPTR